ncbi:MAG: hypothetical protein ABI237_00175 [Ginsengibacter sp.]
MKWILVKVRSYQIRRELESLGLLYAFILLVFLCGLVFFVYTAYHQEEKSLYVFSLTILALLWIHFSRTDQQFVYNHIGHPVQNIFAEYFIFTLPVSIPSLFTSYWFYFPLLIVSIYIIANTRISIKRKTRFPHLSKIISSQNFEWLSGLRKNLIQILILWLLAAIFCRIRILPLIFLWFIMLSVISFYQECESLQILLASSSSPKKLLKRKIINHTRFILLIFIPILIVNSIFNQDLILINIIFLLIQITTFIFAVLLKYTTYVPNKSLKGNTILLSIVSIGTLIPFLLPIPLFMCFKNYGKSVKNLKTYFND